MERQWPTTNSVMLLAAIDNPLIALPEIVALQRLRAERRSYFDTLFALAPAVKFGTS